MLLGSSKTLTYPTGATTVLAFRERTPDAPRPPGPGTVGDPVVLLAGVHVGCFELFGGERVRAVRDLRGRKVPVPEPGVSHHPFVSTMAAHVGLDPRKDIEWVIQPGAGGQRSLAEGSVARDRSDRSIRPPRPVTANARRPGHERAGTP